MAKIYKYSRVGSRLLYKIRHHKGHGIHSPFVFDLITKVIEEKTPYYAYSDIENYLENFPFLTAASDKVCCLLFRFVNYFSPNNILELGSGEGLSSLYLTVFSSSVSCCSVETSINKFEIAHQLYKTWDRNMYQSADLFPSLPTKQDCIYVNLHNYRANSSQLIPYLLSLVDEHSFVILNGIRTNRESRMLWKELVAQDEIVVSLDLFDLGILFFNTKYYKRNYKLSF